MWRLKVLYLQDILLVLSTERMPLQRSFTADKGDKNKNVGGRWTRRSFLSSGSTKGRIRAATRAAALRNKTHSRQHRFHECLSTAHPVDMLERQEKIFSFAHFQSNSSLCLRDVDVGVIREH